MYAEKISQLTAEKASVIASFSKPDVDHSELAKKLLQIDSDIASLQSAEKLHNDSIAHLAKQNKLQEVLSFMYENNLACLPIKNENGTFEAKFHKATGQRSTTAKPSEVGKTRLSEPSVIIPEGTRLNYATGVNPTGGKGIIYDNKFYTFALAKRLLLGHDKSINSETTCKDIAAKGLKFEVIV